MGDARDVGERSPRGALIGVAILAAALFLPTLGHEFVYDDHRFLAGNAALTEPSILWRAFTDPVAQTGDGTHAGLWRPLRTLSFAIDASVGGGATWFAHLHNVLLHGVATWFVAALLSALGAGRTGTVLGALVYAWHPVQVECVAWVSSRGDLLAASLVWAALLLQLRDRPVPAAIVGGAALLAKEQAVVWPAFAFLVVLMSGGRIAEATRRAAIPAALTVAFVVVRHLVLTEPFQEGGVAEGAPGFVELGAMLAHQVWFTLVPVGTVFDWQMPAPAAGIGVVALVPLVLLAWKQTRAPSLWFLAALVPTLFVQAVVPLNIRTADRFLLFALPAVALLVAFAARSDKRTGPAAGIVVLCLAALTATGQSVWASDATLWRATADRFPGHWRAESWLGHAALQDGDPALAASHLRRAAAAAPGDAKTRFRLAEALQTQAMRAQGDDVFELTVAARDAYAEAWRLFPIGRQENRALLAPLSAVRSCDLSLALGQVEVTESLLELLLKKDPPAIPDVAAETWNADVERLATHVEQFLDPRRASPLAPRIRAWKMNP